MSKVKGEIYDLNKSKLRHNLRRVETAHKKRNIKNKIKNNEYRMGGYYLRDEKLVKKYKIIEVPAHTVDVKHLEYKEIEHSDKDGFKYYTKVPVWVVTGQKIIPTHKRRQCIGYQTIELKKPYTKRYSNNIKKYRKLAERKLRNTPLEETYQNGSYKKNYDIAWEVF